MSIYNLEREVRVNYHDLTPMLISLIGTDIIINNQDGDHVKLGVVPFAYAARINDYLDIDVLASNEWRTVYQGDSEHLIHVFMMDSAEPSESLVKKDVIEEDNSVTENTTFNTVEEETPNTVESEQEEHTYNNNTVEEDDHVEEPMSEEFSENVIEENEELHNASVEEQKPEDVSVEVSWFGEEEEEPTNNTVEEEIVDEDTPVEESVADETTKPSEMRRNNKFYRKNK